MDHILTAKEWKRMLDELDKVKYRCSCGKRTIISKKDDKAICSWCGNYVFKDKKEEFKYRIKEKTKKEKK